MTLPAPDLYTRPDAIAPDKGAQKTVEGPALLNAANGWEEVSDALSKAATTAEEGWTDDPMFGCSDLLCTAASNHLTFNYHIVCALSDGGVITREIANGLISTANYFAGTDKNLSDNFQTIKKRTFGS